MTAALQTSVEPAPHEPGRADPRPGLAIITNSNTPYRLAFHIRVTRELPQVRLHSLFTHDVSNSPWVLQCPPEVGAVYFGRGEQAEHATRQPVSEWLKAGRIIEYLRSNNIRLVVLGGYNDTGRIRIIRWCHQAGVHCYLWGDSNIRSDFARGAKRKVKEHLLRYLFSKLAGVMVCGSLGKEFYVAYGERPERIFYMPYEPDYRQIRMLPEGQIAAAAEKFGLAPGRRRIVYSGRLAEVKRVDLFLRAFVQIATERDASGFGHWDAVLVGDGPLREQLQALVPEQLKSRVKWLGFQNDQAVVSAVYRNADVLCLPSSYEPWALVINEAAAAGLAIVSSDVVGASAELVRDSVNGKLFRSGDLSSLVTALTEVTAPDAIDRLRAGSAEVLADWQRRGDPVEGLRKVLRLHGVIPA